VKLQIQIPSKCPTWPISGGWGLIMIGTYKEDNEGSKLTPWYSGQNIIGTTDLLIYSHSLGCLKILEPHT